MTRQRWLIHQKQKKNLFVGVDFGLHFVLGQLAIN